MATVVATLVAGTGVPASAQAVAPVPAIDTLSPDLGRCRTDSGLTIAASLQSRPIGSVRIVTAPPPPIPGAPDAIDNLHIQTRAGTVRRQLLFAAGGTVDTVAVSESLRRLRRLRYLSEVAIVATSCRGRAEVDLAVVTRDAWSTQPSVKLRGTAAAIVGIEERNVLGTGRDAKVYVRSDGAQLGFGVAYADPWVAGTNVGASIARNTYRDGGDWTGGVALRERSVFDRWRANFTVASSVRAAPAAIGDTVRRESATLLLGRRMSRSAISATSLLFGAEYGKAQVAAGAAAAIVGPSAVRREFLGADVGVARRAAVYESVSWYLPGGGLVELPVALEGEAVLGVGRDLAFGRPALHADAWLGRFWMPDNRILVSANAWGSGYRLGQQWTAGSVRLALGIDAAASHGRWSARLAAERLSDPDPDVRALASADPTVAALPIRARLAEAAFATSVERDVYLHRLTGAYTLDAAGFGAGSMRWDPAVGGLRPAVGVLGVGLRLTPARAGMARIGIDIGVPVLRSAGIAPRPFIALTISPWLEANRVRDGQRAR